MAMFVGCAMRTLHQSLAFYFRCARRTLPERIVSAILSVDLIALAKRSYKPNGTAV